MKKTLGILLGIIIISINITTLSSCNKNKEDSVKTHNSFSENHKETIIKEEMKEEEKKFANEGMDVSIVQDIIHRRYKNHGEKIAFLTFDDGPSTNITPKVLDVLKENNIKATFFLCGKKIKEQEVSKEIIKRILEEGHSIGNHSYSHDYYKLYPKENTNVDAFMNEVNETNNLIKEAVGSEFKTRLIRMPNGEMTRRHNKDKNIDKLMEKLKEIDMYSVDWNALTGDEEGKKNKSKGELLQYLKKTSKDKENLVILMHDAGHRKNSLEALPEVIAYLKSEGYEFSSMK